MRPLNDSPAQMPRLVIEIEENGSFETIIGLERNSFVMLDLRKEKSSRFNLKLLGKESVMLRNNKPTPEVVLLSKRSLF
jgi:hypothetical protein